MGAAWKGPIADPDSASFPVNFVDLGETNHLRPIALLLLVPQTQGREVPLSNFDQTVGVW